MSAPSPIDLTLVCRLADHVRHSDEAVDLGVTVVDTTERLNVREMATDYGKTRTQFLSSAWMAEPLGIEIGLELLDVLGRSGSWGLPKTYFEISGASWRLGFVYEPRYLLHCNAVLSCIPIRLSHPILIGDRGQFDADMSWMKMVVEGNSCGFSERVREAAIATGNMNPLPDVLHEPNGSVTYRDALIIASEHTMLPSVLGYFR